MCPSNMWPDAIITHKAAAQRKVSDLPISVHSELNNTLGSINDIKPNLASCFGLYLNLKTLSKIIILNDLLSRLFIPISSSKIIKLALLLCCFFQINLIVCTQI